MSVLDADAVYVCDCDSAACYRCDGCGEPICAGCCEKHWGGPAEPGIAEGHYCTECWHAWRQSDRDHALFLVTEERARQRRMWGDQTHTNEMWLAILMEEVGEAAKCIVDDESNDVIAAEMTQVAAVAVQWLEIFIRERRRRNA